MGISSQYKIPGSSTLTAIGNRDIVGAVGGGLATDKGYQNKFPNQNLPSTKMDTPANRAASQAKADAKAQAAAKKRAADIKKDTKRSQGYIKSLQSSGVDSSWLSKQLKGYGSQISDKEAARIMNDWKSYSSGLTAPANINTAGGYTGSGVNELTPYAASAEETNIKQREAAAEAQRIEAQKQSDFNTWSQGERQRGSAAESFFGNLGNYIGIPTANAATNTPSQGQGWAGQLGNAVVRGLQAATDPFGILPKVSNIIGRNIDNPVTSMANALGLTGLKSGRMDFGVGENMSPAQTEQAYTALTGNAEPDKPTGYGQNGETFYNNNTDPGILNSDVAKPGTNFSRPGSEKAYIQGISPIAYGANQRQQTQDAGVFSTPQLYTPKPSGLAPTQGMQSPWGQTNQNPALAQTGGDYMLGGTNPFSSPLGIGAVGDTSQIATVENPFPGMTPDQTPVAPENGTVRQFLGNGSLSGGMFSNGKGKLNLGGMMSGGGSSPFARDLYSLLDPNNQGGINYQELANNRDQAFSDLASYQNANQGTMDATQNLISSIDPNAAKQSPEYKALATSLINEIPSSNGAAQNYNLPNTTMANLNLTGGSGISSTQPVAPAMVGQSTKSSKTKKAKKSKDPYQALLDQNNQQYQDQVAQQNASLQSILDTQNQSYQQSMDAQNKAYQDAMNQRTQGYNQGKTDRASALQALIDQINTEYGQTSQTSQDTLNQSKQKDLLGLSGMFSFANSDPNDEQRVQYTNRMTNDYTGKLNALLESINQQKAKDVGGAQSNYASLDAQAAQALSDANALGTQNMGLGTAQSLKDMGLGSASIQQANQQTLASLASNRQSIMNQLAQASLAAQQQAQELAATQAQQQWSNNMASKRYYSDQAAQMNSQSQSQQKYQNDLLQSILAQGANMPSGGREYAQQAANALGLGNISAYTPDNWENAYKTPAKSQTMINLGGGKVLDPNTGDVYDTNS